MRNLLVEGRSLLEQGKYDAARHTLRRYLTSVPDDAKAIQALAVAEFNMRNVSEAYQLYRQLLESGHQSASVFYGVALCELAMDKRAEALSSARQAKWVSPTFREADQLIKSIEDGADRARRPLQGLSELQIPRTESEWDEYERGIKRKVKIDNYARMSLVPRWLWWVIGVFFAAIMLGGVLGIVALQVVDPLCGHTASSPPWC